MASVVDTSVKHFLSTMYGAPAITNAPGGMVGLLDACLVTGFGLRAVTSATVAGGVATVNFAVGAAQPPVVESVVLLSGAGTSALNGE